MLLHKWNQRDFLGKCLHLGYEKSDYVANEYTYGRGIYKALKKVKKKLMV